MQDPQRPEPDLSYEAFQRSQQEPDLSYEAFLAAEQHRAPVAPPALTPSEALRRVRAVPGGALGKAGLTREGTNPVTGIGSDSPEVRVAGLRRRQAEIATGQAEGETVARAKPIQDPGLPRVFGRGVKQASGIGLQMAGELADRYTPDLGPGGAAIEAANPERKIFEPAKTLLRRGAEVRAANPVPVEELSQVRGPDGSIQPRKVAQYVAGALGKGVGYMAPSIAAGMMGGTPAVAASAAVFNFGENLGEATELGDSSRGSELRGLAMGAVNTGLDMLTPMAIVKRLKGVNAGAIIEATHDVVRRASVGQRLLTAAKEIAGGLATEGLTETAQEVNTYLGLRVGTEHPIEASVLANRALEAGLQGALSGGAATAVSVGVAEGRRTYQQRKADALQRQQEVPPAAPAPPAPPAAPAAPAAAPSPVGGVPAPAAPVEALEAPAGSVASPRIVQMPTDQLVLKPDEMQFKTTASKRPRIETWNPELAGVVSVWQDPATGEVKVVNGHLRVEAAQRLGVPAMDVQVIQATDVQEARAKGAIINLGDGRGDPTDFAKFLRDSNLSQQDLADRGIRLTEGVAAKGIALSHLAPEIFQLVTAGKMPEAVGVAIGTELADPDLQRQVLTLIKGQKKMSPDEIHEVARQVRVEATENVSQETLFGTETDRVSLVVPKARIVAWLRNRLSADKRLFGFVAREGRAEQLATAGETSIDVAAASQRAQESALVTELFDRLYEKAGPTAKMIEDAARLLAQHPKSGVPSIAGDMYEDVRNALIAEREALFARGPAPAAVAPAPAPSVEPPAVAGLAGRGTPEGVAQAEQPPPAPAVTVRPPRPGELVKVEPSDLRAAETGKPWRGPLWRGEGGTAPMPRGEDAILGAGRYGATEEAAAADFANDASGQRVGRVFQYEANLQNPLVITSDTQWKALTQEAGWPFPNPGPQYTDETRAKIKALRALVEAQGHDGIVVRIPTWMAGNTRMIDETTGKTLGRVFGHSQVIEFAPQQETPAAEADDWSDPAHPVLAGIRADFFSGTPENYIAWARQGDQYLTRDTTTGPTWEATDKATYDTIYRMHAQEPTPAEESEPAEEEWTAEQEQAYQGQQAEHQAELDAEDAIFNEDTGVVGDMPAIIRAAGQHYNTLLREVDQATEAVNDAKAKATTKKGTKALKDAQEQLKWAKEKLAEFDANMARADMDMDAVARAAGTTPAGAGMPWGKPEGQAYRRYIDYQIAQADARDITAVMRDKHITDRDMFGWWRDSYTGKGENKKMTTPWVAKLGDFDADQVEHWIDVRSPQLLAEQGITQVPHYDMPTYTSIREGTEALLRREIQGGGDRYTQTLSWLAMARRDGATDADLAAILEAADFGEDSNEGKVTVAPKQFPGTSVVLTATKPQSWHARYEAGKKGGRRSWAKPLLDIANTINGSHTSYTGPDLVKVVRELYDINTTATSSTTTGGSVLGRPTPRSQVDLFGGTRADQNEMFNAQEVGQERDTEATDDSGRPQLPGKFTAEEIRNRPQAVQSEEFGSETLNEPGQETLLSPIRQLDAMPNATDAQVRSVVMGEGPGSLEAASRALTPTLDASGHEATSPLSPAAREDNWGAQLRKLFKLKFNQTLHGRTLRKIGRDLANATLGKHKGGAAPTREGRMGRKAKSAKGFFQPFGELVRVHDLSDIGTVAHEHGHFISKTYFGWPTRKEASRTKYNRVGRPVIQLGKAVVAELNALGKALYGSTRPAFGYGEEGIAEAFRLFVEDPAKLRADAPGFYEHMQQVFADDPAFAAPWIAAQQELAAYNALSLLEQASLMISVDPQHRHLWSAAEFTRQIMDDNQPTRLAVREAIDIGAKVRADNNPYFILRSLPGVSGEAENVIQHGWYRENPDGSISRITRSLESAIGMIGEGRHQMWRLYLAGMSALDRYAVALTRLQGSAKLQKSFGMRSTTPVTGEKMVRKTHADVLALTPTQREWLEMHYRVIMGGQRFGHVGFTIAQAEAMTNAEQDAEFRAPSEIAWENEQAAIQYRVGTTLTQDRADRIKESHPHHVSFEREFDADETHRGRSGRGAGGFTGSGVPTQVGSSQAILDPIAGLLRNVENTIRHTAERTAIQALTRVAMNSEGGSRIMTPVEHPREHVRISLAQMDEHQVMNALEELGVRLPEELENSEWKDIKEWLEEHAKDITFDLFLKVRGPRSQDARDMVFPVMMPNDTRVWVQMSPRMGDLYDTLMDRTRSESNWFLKVVGPATRVLRAGATGTIEFGVFNLPKDMFTAAAFSRVRYSIPLRNGKNVVIPGAMVPIAFHRMLLGMKSWLREDEWYHKFQLHRADIASFQQQDRRSMQKRLRELYADRGNAPLVRYFMRHPLDFLRLFGSVSEQANRIGELRAMERAATKRGYSQGEVRWKGTMAGRDITQDFPKMGHQMRYINQAVAFSGARTGGLGRIYEEGLAPVRPEMRSAHLDENMGEWDRAQEFWAHIAVAVTLPAIGLFLMNHDDPEYRKIPRWRRFISMHVKIPGTNRYLPIPRPPGIGQLFGYLPELLVEYALENSPPEVQKEIVGTLARELIPVNPLDMTIWRGYAEAASGVSAFFGGPIEGPSIAGLPAEDRYTAGTGETAIALSRGPLGSLARALNPEGEGWNPAGMPFAPFTSPAKTEAFIRGQTGGVGKYVTSASDLAIRAGRQLVGAAPYKTKGMTPDRPLASRLPGIKRYWPADPGLQAEPVRAFYQRYATAEQHRKGWLLRVQKGQPVAAATYLAEHPDINLVATAEMKNQTANGPGRTGGYWRQAMADINKINQDIKVYRRQDTPEARSAFQAAVKEIQRIAEVALASGNH